ncbi:lysine-rich arabinogalactan protein 19-like [Vitis riparia]|uniref:lysine-rich arabinogalactan protein 19-like n=1 Tax=Vitis riparia TaxID=96939 RepID=UPI00155AD614|nr:lysine-rich arabinogalactan protein 19-like [Vitis riparia]
MESVGRLFCTARSPSHGSTTSAPRLEQGELPVETAPPVPTPEATVAALPTTPTVPPVTQTTSDPSITMSASVFHVLSNIPASSTPIAPVDDTTPAEVRIPPPQDEPPTVTASPEEASSPPKAPNA